MVRDGPRGGLVAACSCAAAAQGIYPNMPLAEAQALAPNSFVAPHDPTADRRALEKLAEACEQFTPFVALEDTGERVDGEAASATGETGYPESLLLDITNLQHLHGNEHQLATRVKTFFTRCGYHTRIAIAETLGQAWALAHFDLQRAGASSPPGSDDCKLQIAIPPLPVESLRISSETAALLHALGIQTVPQLQQLPRDDLAQRFGGQLLRRLDQFTGAAPEAIQPHRAVAELEASYDLEEPTADRAVLMHVFNQLLHRLCRRMIERDQGAVLLVCTMQRAGAWAPSAADGWSPSENFKLQNANYKMQIANSSSGSQPSTLDSRLSPAPNPRSPVPHFRIALVQPTANPQQFLELIEPHLETLALADEVDRLQIRAAAVGRLGERQGELFTDHWPADPHQLALLINRLTSRLGHEQVLRASLRNSPVPERAVQWAPMAIARGKGEGGRRKVQGKQTSCIVPPSPFRPPPSARPLLLHPQPHPIKVLSVVPDGPPQCIWLNNRREQIIHHVGPERIETLWWRGRSVRRDYYRVATESGNHLWIFRRLTDAGWYLHGEFA